MNINIIRNNSEAVRELTDEGKAGIQGFQLDEVFIEGARFVEGEDDCERSYNNGRTIADIIKRHLQSTYDCMEGTSKALEDTDREVAKNSLG